MPEEEISKLMVFVENMILSEANVIVCILSMRLANKLDVIYGYSLQLFYSIQFLFYLF